MQVHAGWRFVDRAAPRSPRPVTAEPGGQCVLRSDGVGVFTVSAGGAQEHRLAFAGVRVHGPTVWARLRRVRRVHATQLAAGPARSTADGEPQAVPALVANGAVESGLRCDMTTRLCHGPCGGTRHRADLQVFQDDKRHSPSDFGRGARVKIVAPVALPSTDDVDLGGACVPAPGAWLTTTPPPLQTKQTAPFAKTEKRPIEELAVARRYGVDHPAVNADPAFLQAHSGRDFAGLDQKRDTPTWSVSAQRDRADVAVDRSGAAETHPAQLWQVNGRPVPVQLAERIPALRKAEGGTPMVPSGLRSPSHPGRAVSCACDVQVPQNLLQNLRLRAPQPVKFALRRSQLRTLGRESDERPTLPITAPLFQRGVPHDARNASPSIGQQGLRDAQLSTVRATFQHSASPLMTSQTSYSAALTERRDRRITPARTPRRNHEPVRQEEVRGTNQWSQ